MSAASPHAPLHADVRLLGELLGATLREQEGNALFETVERVRVLAKDARGGRVGREELTRTLQALSTPQSLAVARAFAHFLGLANIAEQHHRIRRRRDYLRTPDQPPQRHEHLLEENPVLRRSIDVRNPYVDPINLVQAEVLSRLREPGADPALFEAFLSTVNGVAAGMRNTG